MPALQQQFLDDVLPRIVSGHLYRSWRPGTLHRSPAEGLAEAYLRDAIATLSDP
ncbi:hypothetical protein ACRAWC_21075 [Leifsonia sp. L25]|uniref:hypothetical protein n=1 Tax=Leifsonia sp. L25 TaxID=3423957 RepID=UPI003D6914F9